MRLRLFFLQLIHQPAQRITTNQLVGMDADMGIGTYVKQDVRQKRQPVQLHIQTVIQPAHLILYSQHIDSYSRVHQRKHRPVNETDSVVAEHIRL